MREIDKGIEFRVLIARMLVFSFAPVVIGIFVGQIYVGLIVSGMAFLQEMWRFFSVKLEKIGTLLFIIIDLTIAILMGTASVWFLSIAGFDSAHLVMIGFAGFIIVTYGLAIVV